MVNTMFFLAMEKAFNNTYISLFFTYLFEKIIIWFKQWNMTRNLSLKTTISEKFLV